MAEDYTRDELWKLYEVLPKELKEAIFSQETADVIYRTCTRNNLEEEKIPEVAKYVGYVLMGLLAPDELEKKLIEVLEIGAEKSKNISQEISRFVFFPLRPILEKLYQKEITQTAKPKSEIKEERPKRRDIYREPIE
jgi:hypothetical protein